MHRTGDALVPVAAGRYPAEHIPGAKYLGLPDSDHTVTALPSQDFIANEIEKFLMSIGYSTEQSRLLTTVAISQVDPPDSRSVNLDGKQTTGLIEDSLTMVNSESIAFRGADSAMKTPISLPPSMERQER